MSALRPAFFIPHLESFISRLNVILCHNLTLSVSEPDNAAAKQGQELRSEQTVTPLHEQSPATYFLRVNNSETFVELVGARLLHLLSQTALPLKSPTGDFIASLRFANAVPPQTLPGTCTTKWKLSIHPKHPIVFSLCGFGEFAINITNGTMTNSFPLSFDSNFF